MTITGDSMHSRRLRVRAHLRNMRGRPFGAQRTSLWSVLPYPTGASAVLYPCEPHFQCVRCGFYEAGHYCDGSFCGACLVLREVFSDLVAQELCARCDVVVRRVSQRYTNALSDSDDHYDRVQLCVLLALARTSRIPRTTRSALRYSHRVTRTMSDPERLFVFNVWPDWDKHPEELVLLAKGLWR